MPSPLITERTWEWLSESKALSEQELLLGIQGFLSRDFAQAFAILRSQRLLSRGRNLLITTEQCNALAKWAHEAKLSNRQSNQVKRHCAITVAFQSIMSDLHRQSDELDIWSLSFGDFSEILLSTVEVIDIELQERMEKDTQESEKVPFLERNATKNWQIRQHLDSCLLIINEAKHRCSTNSNADTGNPRAFSSALKVAWNTDYVMKAWDQYSFLFTNITVSKNTLILHKQNADDWNQTVNYRERSMELDLAKRSRASILFSHARWRISGDLVKCNYIGSLNDFLYGSNFNILYELLEPTKTLRSDLRESLAFLVDLTKEVKLGKTRHRYSDLITAWCYLYRLAIAAQIWGDGRRLLTGEFPAVIISLEDILKSFTGLGPRDAEAENKAVRHFTTRDGDRMDFFHTPLLKLDGGGLLLAISFIKASRFDRNLLSVIAREQNDALAVKGRKPLRAARDLFEKAGFLCMEDIQVKGESGITTTDLDLLAVLDNEAFFFQSKVISTADTAYEFWKSEQILLSAAVQMDKVMARREQVKLSFEAQYPGNTFTTITPYIITDFMFYSGFAVGSYTVVDYEYLIGLLKGGEYAVFNPFTREVHSLINRLEGEFPTPNEIRRLINDLRNPRKVRSQHAAMNREVKAGGWTLDIRAS